MQYRFNCHSSLWLTLPLGPSPFLALPFPTKNILGSLFDDCLLNHALMNGFRVHAELTTLRLDCHNYPIDWHLGGKMSWHARLSP